MGGEPGRVARVPDGGGHLFEVDGQVFRGLRVQIVHQDDELPFADREAGFAREAVVADYEAAVTEHGVRAIPTVIVPETGRALVGLADLAVYRAAIEEAAG